MNECALRCDATRLFYLFDYIENIRKGTGAAARAPDGPDHWS